MSIPADDTPTGLSDADAIAALTGALSGKGAPQASQEDPEDEDLDEAEDEQELEGGEEDDDLEEEDEDPSEDDEEGDEEEEEETPASAAPEVTDETVLKITVDGEEQEVSIGALKRLAGQEASLTRKSQEADTVGQRAAAMLSGSLDLVLEDLAAYDDVDWVLEGNRMDPEEFQWHREQFGKLMQRRDKLISGAQGLSVQMEQRQHQQLQEQAVEAIRVLKDPQVGIPGWSEELYGDILGFAVEAGLPEDDVAKIVNPAVIKIINDARLYRQGQKAAAEKVNLTPARTRKTSGREAIPAADTKVQKGLERKLKSGTATDDDAMAALMGRWGVKRR